MIAASTYDKLWCGLLRLHVIWPITRFRCSGNRPAWTWFDHPEGGYFRRGVQRQYCVRFTGHRGRCLAMITHLGVESPCGSRFDPEVNR